MKDILIGFIIALVLGSIWNSVQQPADSISQASGELASQQIASVSQSDFQNEVLNQNQPVLVAFYTQTCPHFKKMAPILGQIAQQYLNNLKVVKLEIMENQDLARQFNIGGSPTFILFQNGRPVESFMGEMSKEKLLSILRPHLLNAKTSAAEISPAT